MSAILLTMAVAFADPAPDFARAIGFPGPSALAELERLQGVCERDQEQQSCEVTVLSSSSYVRRGGKWLSVLYQETSTR